MCGGRETHLSPKGFELLRVLVENRPRVVSKTELIERIWPGVFVSDVSLAKTVSKIRKAVGQPDDASIIRTVHGCGYAFAAGVTASEPREETLRGPVPATCWLFCGRREFPLSDGEHIVGRDPEAGIRLASPKVSRRHAKIVVRHRHAVLTDLGSKNGSFVRGLRVTRPTPLEPGDDIQIGPFTLTFWIADDARSTESEVL